jgi:hypothetical protein
VPTICGENWTGDAFGISLSYTANLMRCAANLGDEKNFGVYIRPLRFNDSLAPIYAVMTYAGYGCKNFFFFNYGHGPHQPDSWSEYPALYPAIRNALDMLGQAEDLLYPGQLPAAQVAVLYPGASDIWNKASIRLYKVEAHGIYHALRHDGYAVDLIDEIELKDKFFSDNINGKNNYRVLYITGPNIPRSAIEPLKAWVKAGNTVIVTNGAAIKDEYHEKFVDADGLDALLGLESKSREEERTPIGSLLVNPRQDIKIDNLSYGESTPFLLADNSHPLKISLLNGATAIVSGTKDSNVYATEYQSDPTAGKAITFGMYFGAAYMMNYNIGDNYNVDTRTIRPTNWNPILRKLIVAPVKQLGITKPVEIDQDLEIECCRLESAAGIGIVLLNWSGRKVEKMKFKVTNNGAFTNVKSVKQGILGTDVIKVVGNDLEIEVSLDNVDVLMIT